MARGDWRRTSTGLYVPSSVDPARPEQRAVEVAARLPAGCALTGWASLLFHGGNHFDGLGHRMEPLPVQVALPLECDIRRTPDVARLRSPLPDHEIVMRHGIAVTIPGRALFDLMARCRSPREAAVHASVACSAGLIGRAEFVAYVGRRRCIAGIVRVREALPLIDDRVRSPKEAELLNAWTLDAEMPRPLMNWPVYDCDGGYVGAPDLLSVELGVYGEYQGRDHDLDEARGIDAERDVNFPSVGLVGFKMVSGDRRDTRHLVRRIARAVEIAKQMRGARRFVLATDPEPVVERERRALAREAGEWR